MLLVSSFSLLPFLVLALALGFYAGFSFMKKENLIFFLLSFRIFLVGAILVFLAPFFKQLPWLLGFPSGWFQLETKWPMSLAAVPFNVTIASPFAGRGVALAHAAGDLLPASAFRQVELSSRASLILAVGASEHEDGSIDLAFPAGHPIIILDFGLA